MSLTVNQYNPIYILNDYVYSLCKQEGYLDLIDNLVPITTSDGPQLQDSGKSYLVYAYAEENFGDLTPLKSCTATYAVFGTKAIHTNNIIQLLSLALSREESASNVMNWARHEENPKSEQFKGGVNIVSVEVLGSESAMPPDEEGGLTDGYIVIRYRYTIADQNSYSIIP